MNSEHAMIVAQAQDKYVFGKLFQECVACGSTDIALWRRKRFQYTDKTHSHDFSIYKCANCGTGFLNPPPHKEWLSRIYACSGHALTEPITLAEVLEREKRFPNSTVDATRMAINASKLNHSSNTRALDVGSGFGFYTKALRQLNYQTISLNPGLYENAVFQELNDYLPMPVMFEDFQDLKQFGVVLMSQVLEHIVEPHLAIQKASSLLAPEGVLVCAVPNFRSLAVRLLGTKDNACLWVPEHVNYFTLDGLRRLLECYRLKIVQVQYVTRIPFDALSRRLKKGKTISFMLDNFVRLAQIPLAPVGNSLGMGIYINVYAVKS